MFSKDGGLCVYQFMHDDLSPTTSLWFLSTTLCIEVRSFCLTSAYFVCEELVESLQIYYKINITNGILVAPVLSDCII